MKLILPSVLSVSLLLAPGPRAQAQQASPYKTRFAVDGPITLGLGAVSLTGLY
ncbi:MAG: phosphatase family protein, partial [Hymenobacter sp.]|nr:phosphatase family protein [Hymenobacter sp.]